MIKQTTKYDKYCDSKSYDPMDRVFSFEFSTTRVSEKHYLDTVFKSLVLSGKDVGAKIPL